MYDGQFDSRRRILFHCGGGDIGIGGYKGPFSRHGVDKPPHLAKLISLGDCAQIQIQIIRKLSLRRKLCISGQLAALNITLHQICKTVIKRKFQILSVRCPGHGIIIKRIHWHSFLLSSNAA